MNVQSSSMDGICLRPPHIPRPSHPPSPTHQNTLHSLQSLVWKGMCRPTVQIHSVVIFYLVLTLDSNSQRPHQPINPQLHRSRPLPLRTLHHHQPVTHPPFHRVRPANSPHPLPVHLPLQFPPLHRLVIRLQDQPTNPQRNQHENPLSIHLVSPHIIHHWNLPQCQRVHHLLLHRVHHPLHRR